MFFTSRTLMSAMISGILQREPQPHYYSLLLWLGCAGPLSSAKVNLHFTFYSLYISVYNESHDVIFIVFSPFISKMLTKFMEKVTYRLQFTKSTRKTTVHSIDYSYTSHDVVSLILCALLGLWYLFKKVSKRFNITFMFVSNRKYSLLIYDLLQHWIANNLFGIAFAINGVEMLLLNKMVIGCILLGGLFVYDIFWVFYTDVMVTVAKSFEAPIKRK